MSQRRRGNVWMFSISVGPGPDGKYREIRRSGFTSKRLAKIAEDDFRAKGLHTLAPGADRFTVASYLETWLGWKKPSLAPSSLVSYESVIRVHINPALGSVKLQKLRPIDLKLFYADLPSDSIALVIHNGVLHPALEEAVTLELLPSSPAGSVRPVRGVATEKRRFATPAEITRVFAAADQTEFGAMVRLAVFTGLRRGELLGLKWDDISEGQLTVSRQGVRAPGKGAAMVLKTPKTKASSRSLSIGPDAVALLRAQKKLQAEAKMAERLDYRDRSLVIADEFGGIVSTTALRATWRQIVREAGVSWLHFHDLRHCYATLALLAGVPMKVVSENLGHTGIALTADLYSHVLPSVHTDAALRLEAVLREAVQ